MYIRLINNIPVSYTIEKLRNDEPGISFPDIIPQPLLEQYNVFPVVVSSRPEINYDQDATLREAVYENGQWIYHWDIITVDQETLTQRIERQENAVRSERDRLLRDSDWTQAKDIPDHISSVWQPYRQQLRDVPQQEGFPFNVVWPVVQY